IPSHMLQSFEADDLIEFAGLGRKVVEVAMLEPEPRGIGAAMAHQEALRLCRLCSIEIHRDNVRARLVSEPGEIAVAAAGIEHTPRSCPPEPHERSAVADMKVQARIDQTANCADELR